MSEERNVSIRREVFDINDAGVSGRLMSLAAQEDGSSVGQLVTRPGADPGGGVFGLSFMPVRFNGELAERAREFTGRDRVLVRGYLENTGYTLSLAQALEWWSCEDVVRRFWPERIAEAEDVRVHVNDNLLVCAQASSAKGSAQANWAQVGGVVAALRIIEGGYTEVHVAAYDEHTDIIGEAADGLPLRKAHYAVALLPPGTLGARLGLGVKAHVRISGKLAERRPEQTLLGLIRWLGLEEWEKAYRPEELAAVPIPMAKPQLLAEAVVLPSRGQYRDDGTDRERR